MLGLRFEKKEQWCGGMQTLTSCIAACTQQYTTMNLSAQSSESVYCKLASKGLKKYVRGFIFTAFAFWKGVNFLLLVWITHVLGDCDRPFGRFKLLKTVWTLVLEFDLIFVYISCTILSNLLRLWNSGLFWLLCLEQSRTEGIFLKEALICDCKETEHNVKKRLTSEKFSSV